MKTTKKLTNSGSSLVINVTMEARIMGLNRGDYVEIVAVGMMRVTDTVYIFVNWTKRQAVVRRK